MSKMAFIEEPVVGSDIMEDLCQRFGYDEYDTTPDNQILKLSGFDFLDELLKWHGIIGYTEMIINAIYEAYGIDLTEYPFDEPIKRTKDEYSN